MDERDIGVDIACCPGEALLEGLLVSQPGLAPLIQVRLCQGRKYRGGNWSGHAAPAPVRGGQDQGVSEGFDTGSTEVQRLCDLPGSPDVLAQSHGANPVPDIWVSDGIRQPLLLLLAEVPADEDVLEYVEHVPFRRPQLVRRPELVISSDADSAHYDVFCGESPQCPVGNAIRADQPVNVIQPDH